MHSRACCMLRCALLWVQLLGGAVVVPAAGPSCSHRTRSAVRTHVFPPHAITTTTTVPPPHTHYAGNHDAEGELSAREVAEMDQSISNLSLTQLGPEGVEGGLLAHHSVAQHGAACAGPRCQLGHTSHAGCAWHSRWLTLAALAASTWPCLPARALPSSLQALQTTGLTSMTRRARRWLRGCGCWTRAAGGAAT